MTRYSKIMLVVISIFWTFPSACVPSSMVIDGQGREILVKQLHYEDLKDPVLKEEVKNIIIIFGCQLLLQTPIGGACDRSFCLADMPDYVKAAFIQEVAAEFTQFFEKIIERLHNNTVSCCMALHNTEVVSVIVRAEEDVIVMYNDPSHHDAIIDQALVEALQKITQNDEAH